MTATSAACARSLSAVTAFSTCSAPARGSAIARRPAAAVFLDCGKAQVAIGEVRRNVRTRKTAPWLRVGGQGMSTAARASATSLVSKTISVGEKLPDAELSYFDKEGNLQIVKVSELTKGKKVVLFAVPGAFTPTCSQKHLPGFVEKAEELRSKGVDTIACVSVNDTFVMQAWGDSLGVGDKVLLLSDGNAVFTKALGVTVDLSDKPALLGVRSRRYALLAEDGVVKALNLEEGGAFTVSGPDEILKAL